MAGIDLSAMQAEFKNFYRDHNQDKNSLMNKILTHTNTEAYYDDERPILDDVEEMGFVRQTVHVQQWSDVFTPGNNLKIEVEQARVQKLKVDLECTPDELESTWMAFLINTKEQDPSKYPFVAWWLEEMAMPAWRESWEMNEVYKGVKAAVIPVGGTMPGQGINGIEKTIKDGITAGKITPQLLGPPPAFGSANADIEFVEYVEEFVYSIDYKERRKLKDVLCDSERIQMYIDGKRKKLGLVVNPQGLDLGPQGLLKIKDSGLSIMGVDSMDGKDRLVTTRKGNAFKLTRRIMPSAFRLLPVQYERVGATFKFSQATGFWYLPWVHTTNVD